MFTDTNRAIITLTLLTCFNMAFVVMEDVAAMDKCECAAFSVQSEEIDPSQMPIMSQSPINVTCNEEGSKTCEVICIDLVKLGKERAPEILCSQVKHSDGLKPSLYTKTCNGVWKYSGLTCEHTICCHEGLSIPCETPPSK